MTTEIWLIKFVQQGLLAGPGIVENLRSTIATFNSITLTWDELSCVDHNGPFIGYRIEYSNVTFDHTEMVYFFYCHWTPSAHQLHV